MKKLPKPEPVIKQQVCSVCDEPWDKHEDVETEGLMACIRLLKTRPRVQSLQYNQCGPIGSSVTYLSNTPRQAAG